MTDSNWTDGGEAYVAHWGLPEGHPSRVVARFHELLSTDPIEVDALQSVVTPESIQHWGSFDGAREFLDRLAISNRTLRVPGAADVAFIKLVEGSQARVAQKPESEVAYVALVWRPSLGGWRIHGIGGPIPADQLPREKTLDDAPTYDTDANVILE
ncbi:hypothetical protein [Agromyces cerinus]|uniref:Uncharacterized protein n=1 Tax=Agromyces cerinus subsp. cerinus TaxID=232089 RepID=A0A1N6F9M0_9MICO|nr:hypothetical protein [Agromyces cerinus]SIN91973.1 hypothetical protein SAMN05443544_1868 [Agromyces cerinus subsp. cerinus]